MNITVEKEGILYKNSHPGFRAECAYLPNIITLPDNSLLCFMRLGQAFYSADGNLVTAKSTDGGETWDLIGTVWDTKVDPRPYSYSAPHCTLLKDGRLVLIAFRFDASDPDRFMFNHDTEGMAEMENILFFSSDLGETWSKPYYLDLPFSVPSNAPSSVIELEDGSLFLGIESWKSWDDRSLLHIKTFGIYSEDGGKTWGDPVSFPSNNDKKIMYSHSRFIKTSRGTVAALQWAQKLDTKKDLDLHFVESDTTGKKWGLPVPTGIMGQTSWLAEAPKGRYIAAYTRREREKPGIYTVVSEPGGKKWDTDNPVILWDAVGQEFLGVEKKPSYPASHDNIAFGKPHLLRLSEDRYIASWWCTQACVTHSRYAIINIT